jgi:hypothetical protein
MEELKGGIGVFTTSTSRRAFKCFEILEENPAVRKALIVCRVIAGRVHRPLFFPLFVAKDFGSSFKPLVACQYVKDLYFSALIVSATSHVFIFHTIVLQFFLFIECCCF